MQEKRLDDGGGLPAVHRQDSIDLQERFQPFRRRHWIATEVQGYRK